MKLTIIKPDHVVEHQILWLEVITDQGSFIIQPEHAPTVFVLAHGHPLTFCLKDNTQESIIVMQGVVEVSRTNVLVLLSESK